MEAGVLVAVGLGAIGGAIAATVHIRRVRLNVCIMVAFGFFLGLVGGLVDIPAGNTEADAILHTTDQHHPRPTLQDADLSTRQECMDLAFELANSESLLYGNGTVALVGRESFTKSTLPVANMMWYIAVCDRMFPEAGP